MTLSKFSNIFKDYSFTRCVKFTHNGTLLSVFHLDNSSKGSFLSLGARGPFMRHAPCSSYRRHRQNDDNQQMHNKFSSRKSNSDRIDATSSVPLSVDIMLGSINKKSSVGPQDLVMKRTNDLMSLTEQFVTKRALLAKTFKEEEKILLIIF